MQVMLPKGKVEYDSHHHPLKFFWYRDWRMEIVVNNIRKSVPEDITLNELMQKELNGNYRGIAVAVDKKIIPRENWNAFRLKDGQHILIIKATQGG